MYCPKCGKYNPEDSKKCKHCGASLVPKYKKPNYLLRFLIFLIIILILAYLFYGEKFISIIKEIISLFK